MSPFDLFDNDKTPSKIKARDDRFIPQRGTPASQQDLFLLTLNKASHSDVSDFSEKEKDTLLYNNLLEQKILNFDGFFNDSKKPLVKSTEKPYKKRNKLLQFSQKKENGDAAFPSIFSLEDNEIEETQLTRSIRHSRRIPRAPLKVLDAPGLEDDFYQVN